jgi:transposase InsO family protein
MSWDLIGPLLESRTYDAIVTMMDTRTKAIKLEPANVMITAMGVAIIMRNWVYREEGLLAKVISDQGPQFVSRFVKELYGLLGIEGNPSTAYHPQTDGQTERVNREVEKYLRMFISHRQDDWVDWLPLTEFAFNNAVHEAMGQSPFFLNKGRHPRAIPMDKVAEEGVAGEYLEELQKAARAAEESLAKAKNTMKKQWDKNK